MWKSKKDLKIKELEHTIRNLHTQLQGWQRSSEHYRQLKNDYSENIERLMCEKEELNEIVIDLKLELLDAKKDVATLIKHIDKLEGDKNNEK